MLNTRPNNLLTQPATINADSEYEEDDDESVREAPERPSRAAAKQKTKAQWPFLFTTKNRCCLRLYAMTFQLKDMISVPSFWVYQCNLHKSVVGGLIEINTALVHREYKKKLGLTKQYTAKAGISERPQRLHVVPNTEINEIMVFPRGMTVPIHPNAFSPNRLVAGKW